MNSSVLGGLARAYLGPLLLLWLGPKISPDLLRLLPPDWAPQLAVAIVVVISGLPSFFWSWYAKRKTVIIKLAKIALRRDPELAADVADFLTNLDADPAAR